MLKKLQKIGLILIVLELIMQISLPAVAELSIFTSTESLAVTGTSDSRFEYSLNKDGTSITITKYVGTDTEVVIPSTIDGYKVTSIGEYAFYGCRSLTSINIPEGVTSIRFRAFYGCSSLTSINVDSKNEKYKSIDGVLYNKEGTYLITYPIKKEGTSYVIPEGVTIIGSDAFYGCSSLTSINIPEGVTSIKYSAFRGCSSLTSINIPEGVTSIGDYAFYECSSLTSINIPEGVTIIGSDAFYGCSSLTSINIPEGVTSIGNYTFQYCSRLTSINIPEGVTSIGDYAFSGCRSLTSINIPEGVTSIENYTFCGCRSLTSINIPEGVTSIGDYAFDRCSSLTSINIPEGVTSIGDRAFYGCSNLTSIIIPKEVTNIGESAFTECNNLVITCKSNSIAHEYAVANNINYKLDDIAPILTVKYTPASPTRENVIVNITSNEELREVEGWKLSENRMQITKTYTDNKVENIEVCDLVGNVKTQEINISNIDRIPPILTVEYSTTNLTNQNVVVTIKSNEQVQGVAGWTLSSDKKSLSKTYTANGSESITVKDLAGNSSSIEVKVENIDKTAPKIEGVENGKIYTSVTPKVTDENLNTVVLTKDGQVISYTNGTQIKENGNYELTATDKLGNSTKVTFTIVEKAEITSTKYTIDETNKYITNLKAGTTKEELKANIKANIEYKITTKDGKEVTTEKIGTGMKIEFTTRESYEIVVKGDVNGDGKISTTDITKLKKHIIKKETLVGCYERAGNVNEDTKISVTDLAKMKKALVGLVEL